jgi:hypothetical protein
VPRRLAGRMPGAVEQIEDHFRFGFVPTMSMRSKDAFTRP